MAVKGLKIFCTVRAGLSQGLKEKAEKQIFYNIVFSWFPGLVESTGVGSGVEISLET